MSTQLFFAKDIQAQNAYAPIPSTDIYTATLVNGAAASITLPTTETFWIVSFSYQPGASVWVDFSGTTAAAPVGATFAASSSELNPGARLVKSTAGDNATAATISLLTTNASTGVSVALYKSYSR